MAQTIRKRIADQMDRLNNSDLLPFHEILDATMVKDALNQEGVVFHERLYTPLVTVALFLSQVLCPDHSCRKAVARLIAWLTINGHRPCSAETNSYCEARQRLPLPVVQRLVRQTARETEAAASNEWLWKGRPVALVDGTTASMPDTPENQREFPQSSVQGIGLGFPLARIVALISLSTGVLRDLALGPYQGKETGETALFRTLESSLNPGDVVLGDRVFASYFGIAALQQRGADGLFRMHQSRKFDFRCGRRLGVMDHVVRWQKPARPAWMDEATYAGMPEELEVREIRVKVEQAGFRVDELVLVTTMLDPEEFPKEELADLFLDRWHVELDLRSIKVEMKMEVLRCKTPEMVKKEIWMHMLAYNLIRGVMSQAAEAHGAEPRRISFKGTLQTMTVFEDHLRHATAGLRNELIAAMLAAIASHRVGDRPNRVEPRANKRRPRKQRYLNEPRAQARKRLLTKT